MRIDRPDRAGVLLLNGQVLVGPYNVYVEEGAVFVVDGADHRWTVFPLGVALDDRRRQFDGDPRYLDVWDTSRHLLHEMAEMPFEVQAARLTELLQARYREYDVYRSLPYGDVLVDIDHGAGVVVLRNRDARPSGPMGKPVAQFPADRAAAFARRLEDALADGWTVVIEGEVLVVMPFPAADVAQSFDHLLRYQAYVPEPLFLGCSWDAIRLLIAAGQAGTARSRRLVPVGCGAVIFFPDLEEQSIGCGDDYSTYPLELAFDLAEAGISTVTYLNGAASLEKWIQWISGSGRTIMARRDRPIIVQPLQVIYNQGHGGIDTIHCLNGPVSQYLRADHVRQVAQLDQSFVLRRPSLFNEEPVPEEIPRRRGTKPLIYVHSCSTANSASDLPSAFVDRGAETYVGWREPTTAWPWYCDSIDRRFWMPLLPGRQPVSFAEYQARLFEAEVGCEHHNIRVTGSPSWKLRRSQRRAARQASAPVAATAGVP